MMLQLWCDAELLRRTQGVVRFFSGSEQRRLDQVERHVESLRAFIADHHLLPDGTKRWEGRRLIRLAHTADVNGLCVSIEARHLLARAADLLAAWSALLTEPESLGHLLNTAARKAAEVLRMPMVHPKVAVDPGMRAGFVAVGEAGPGWLAGVEPGACRVEFETTVELTDELAGAIGIATAETKARICEAVELGDGRTLRLIATQGTGVESELSDLGAGLTGWRPLQVTPEQAELIGKAWHRAAMFCHSVVVLQDGTEVSQ